MASPFSKNRSLIKEEESLSEKLQRIYAPMEGVEFKARYEARRTIKITGHDRDVLEVDPQMNKILEEICSNLEKEEFEGKPLSEVVWKGITMEPYKLWVVPLSGDHTPGSVYSCVVTIKPEIFKGLFWKKPQYRAGMNINITIAASSLRGKLETIYAPIEGVEFEAEYEGRMPMITGGERDIWKVSDSSTTMNTVLDTICTKLEEDFAGKPLSSIVWSGITGNANAGFKLWIYVSPMPFNTPPLSDEKVHGWKVESIDIFEDVEWKKPQYQAGVNINIIVQV